MQLTVSQTTNVFECKNTKHHISTACLSNLVSRAAMRKSGSDQQVLWTAKRVYKQRVLVPLSIMIFLLVVSRARSSPTPRGILTF
jgi:hypothetical protein